MKKPNSGNEKPVKERRKFQEYKFTQKLSDAAWQEEAGFIDVQLSEEMMEDLSLNTNFQRDLLNGNKKVVGKL